MDLAIFCTSPFLAHRSKEPLFMKHHQPITMSIFMQILARYLLIMKDSFHNYKQQLCTVWLHWSYCNASHKIISPILPSMLTWMVNKDLLSLRRRWHTGSQHLTLETSSSSWAARSTGSYQDTKLGKCDTTELRATDTKRSAGVTWCTSCGLW